METRSVLDTEKGPVIIKTILYSDGQMATEITAVDVHRGKNVSVALGPKELATLERHIRELKQARRSEKAKEAWRKRGNAGKTEVQRKEDGAS